MSRPDVPVSDVIETLLTAVDLKDERRTGWQLRGVSDPESVAAHTWSVALLCLLCAERAEADIDVDRALRLAIIHDLGEAVIGDIPATTEGRTVDPTRKATMEREAIDDVLGSFDDLRNEWCEYEAGDSPEAVFVKDMDLIDMCLQALKYDIQGRIGDTEDGTRNDDGLDEFFVTSEPRLRTEVGKGLFAAIRARYEHQLDRRGSE